MANATVSRLGQINAAGDALALFLKVYAGEVLTAFETTTVMNDKQVMRNISSGKSAQFPATWKASAAYHTPGTEINGTAIKHAEKIINIDGLLLSDAFIASIDEAMNHYDVRSEYSVQQGRELAKQFDVNSLRNVILAARGTNPFGETAYDGQELINVSMKTDATVLGDAIWTAAQGLDERDVPDEERYGVFRPAQYYLLAGNTNLLNKDWGGSGNYAEASIPVIAGVGIHKSNNMPIDDSTGEQHAVVATTTAGVVFQKGAVGTVKLLDLGLESEYDIRRQGTLMVAKYAVGHGALRPESAAELKTA